MRRECVRSRVRVESVRIEYIGVYVDICEYYVGCETELGQIRGLETYNERCGGLGSSTIFKKFNEPYAPS